MHVLAQTAIAYLSSTRALSLTSQDWNRIVQLEGTFREHLVHLPDLFRANEKLKHVEGIVQTPPERWQAWGINHLTGKSLFHSALVALSAVVH